MNFGLDPKRHAEEYANTLEGCLCARVGGPQAPLQGDAAGDAHQQNSAAAYPTVFEFNGCGTLLAVGSTDGSVVIWNVYTRNVRCIFSPSRQSTTTAQPHPPITALCWGPASRQLFVCTPERQNGPSGDEITGCRLQIWNVARSEVIESLFIPQSVISIQAHPHHQAEALLCMGMEVAEKKGGRYGQPTFRPFVLTLQGDGEFLREDAPLSVAGNERFVGAMSWNTTGELVVVATPTTIILVNTEWEVMGRHVVRTRRNDIIQGMQFSPCKKKLLINAGGSIKIMDTTSYTVISEVRDVVSGVPWTLACFGSGIEHWAGSETRYVYAAEGGTVSVYDISHRIGELKTRLSSPHRFIMHLRSHGRWPLLIVNHSSSVLYVWHRVFHQSITRFLPLFREKENTQTGEPILDVEDEGTAFMQMLLEYRAVRGAEAESVQIDDTDSLDFTSLPPLLDGENDLVDIQIEEEAAQVQGGVGGVGGRRAR